MLKNQQAPSKPRLLAVLAASCALWLGLDLWTKQWVWDHLRPTGETVAVWGQTLELHFAYNLGSAFGVVRRLDYPLVIALLTTAMIGWVIATALGAGASRLRAAAAGMVVAGGLGNLHDRLLRDDGLGHRGVVDFIRVNFPWGGSWPSFNVADAALVIGVVLLVWTLRAPSR